MKNRFTNYLENYKIKDDLKLWKFFLNNPKFEKDKKIWDLLWKKHGYSNLFKKMNEACNYTDNRRNYVVFIMQRIKNSKKPVDMTVEEQNNLLSLFEKFQWLFFKEEKNKEKYIKLLEEEKQKVKEEKKWIIQRTNSAINRALSKDKK